MTLLLSYRVNELLTSEHDTTEFSKSSWIVYNCEGAMFILHKNVNIQMNLFITFVKEMISEEKNRGRKEVKQVSRIFYSQNCLFISV